MTICIFLDGENAWEYYPGNGREFLRQFYKRIAGDSDFRALTASEAIAASKNTPTTGGIFPASWINANFDVWIGSEEDVAAWELLWDARQVYASCVEAEKQERPDAPTKTGLAQALESLLAAEGSDWCWWYGPEHSTANDAEFDALFRKHLTGIYLALGQVAPVRFSQAHQTQTGTCPADAADWIPKDHDCDGRDTSYFEWLGAGLFSPERRGGAMHGRIFYLRELRYGFEEDRFSIRVDSFHELLSEMDDPEFRITIGGADELTVVVKLERGKVRGVLHRKRSGLPAESEKLCQRGVRSHFGGFGATRHAQSQRAEDDTPRSCVVARWLAGRCFASGRGIGHHSGRRAVFLANRAISFCFVLP